MNLRCKVCGEKAAGFHFGAFTCEGCKSFFGRCCNNMSIIGECRNNKECVINKKNRTSCKACRLQKCLQVGMSKSGSRYGRRSNWFKQYFQETEHIPRARDKSSSSPPLTLHDSESEQRYPLPDQLKFLDKTAYSGVSVVTADADAAEDHKKIRLPFDLYAATQPLISSHLYLNCFPSLGLNRLVSYKQAASCASTLADVAENATTGAAFLLPPTLSFSRLFPDGGAEQANVNEYFEKIFVARYDRDDEYDRRISDTIDNDDNNNPLDLSSKPHRSKEQKIRRRSSQHYETELSKKASPLDLSVK